MTAQPTDGSVAIGRPGRFEVRGVTVRFGGLTALDDVSLHVEPGEVLGVIGPNGAGKTTLFNVVCGFLRPNAGELVWRDDTLRGLRPHKLAGLGIARTLQGVGLFPHMSVLENVLTGANVRGRAGFASAVLGLPRSDRSGRIYSARQWPAPQVLVRRTVGRKPGCRERHRSDRPRDRLDGTRLHGVSTPARQRDVEAIGSVVDPESGAREGTT